MFRLVVASSLLAFFSASALQVPSSFECRFCHELSKAVVPRAALFAAGVRPPHIPEPLWNAIRSMLPQLLNDPQCYSTCVRPQMHWMVPGRGKSSVQCPLCQQLMEIGKPFASSSEIIFEEQMETSCKHLDFLEGACLMIVTEHGKQMYELERKNVAHLAACTQMKLCP